MAIRYALLPHLYTLFHTAHTTGATVMRALAWEFPNDPRLAAVETQFLLGADLLVVPVLSPNASTVNGVFPGVAAGSERWYDWYTHEAVAVSGAGGENVTLEAPLGHIPVFVRGGAVLAMQEVRLTTREARETAWGLLVALGVDGGARGSLYVDDGESVEGGASRSVEFVVEGGSGRLSAKATGAYRDGNGLANVTVVGVGEEPRGDVTVNGVVLGEGKRSWDGERGVLRLTGLEEVVGGGAWDEDWVIGW